MTGSGAKSRALKHSGSSVSSVHICRLACTGPSEETRVLEGHKDVQVDVDRAELKLKSRTREPSTCRGRAGASAAIKSSI